MLTASLVMVSVSAHMLAAAPMNPNLKIMSFYGMNVTLQKDWLTLAMAEGDLANEFYASGVHSLAPMPETGVYLRGGKGVGTSLVPGWESVLGEWYSSIKPQVENGTIIGTFMGDEICCHNVSCWGKVITPLSQELRNLFGSDAMIYENDCGDSFVGLDHIAPALSHVSFDLYAGFGPNSGWHPGGAGGVNGSVEPEEARAFAEKEVYPRMHAGQKLLLVPGTFACSNLSYMPIATSDKSVSDKLMGYFDWAKQDTIIGGFNPWHFNDRSHSQNDKDPCDMRLGIASLPNAMSVVSEIGKYIKQNIMMTSAAKEKPHIPTKAIGSGVQLPMLYMGFGNFTEWLRLVGSGAGIKTAWTYHNQNTLLPAVQTAGLSRKDVFIETMIPCGGVDGNPEPMNRSMAEWYIENDLKELGTNYVDLLLVHHRCKTDNETSLVWSVLESALDRGVTKAIGVSNFDADDLAALMPYTTKPISVNEAHFAVGVIDNETIKYCNEHNIALVSFSSLSAGVPMNNSLITSIASKHQVSNAAVMLRFVLQHNISILSSISNPEYLAEDVGIFSFTLDDEDMSALTSLQTGKRTCPDCYTEYCQNCAATLASLGCNVGHMPAAGRDNPDAAQCIVCASNHSESALKACGADYMVLKACGQAGGFPS